MLWTGTDWTVIAAQAGGVAAVLYGGYKWIAKKDPKLVKTVEEDITHSLPHGVAAVIDDAGKLVRGLVESPWFAGAAATGKVELHHITSKLLDSHLSAEIAKTLAAAGKTWSDMSETEKGALITTVQAGLSKLGVTVTSKQVTDAVSAVEEGIAAVQPAMAHAAQLAADITQPQGATEAAAKAK